MNNKEKQELKYLASSIFTEKEYYRFEKLLNQNKLLSLRLFIDEMLDIREAIFTTIKNIEDGEVLKTQLEMLNKMEDIIIYELENYDI